MPDRHRFICINVKAEPGDGRAAEAVAVPGDPPQPPRARTSPHPAATSGTTDLAERSVSRRTIIFTFLDVTSAPSTAGNTRVHPNQVQSTAGWSPDRGGPGAVRLGAPFSEAFAARS